MSKEVLTTSTYAEECNNVRNIFIYLLTLKRLL